MSNNSQSQLDDKQILQDMLMTEKYTSSMYENSVMESANLGVRKTMQKIQEDEQGHAKMIFDAMVEKGWYQVQPASKG